MAVVRSPVRSVVRSPVRGVFGAGDTQTDLQRLLALSPSLLIWPANGAGWQGTSGGTLAASGQPLGLGVDLSQLEGKTLGEWLAAPTTTDQIPNGVVGLVGTATAATYNTATGEGSVTRVDASNQSSVGWSSLGTQPYYLVVECLTGTLGVRQTSVSGATVAAISAGATTTVVLQPGSGAIVFTHNFTGAGTATFRITAFRELPGNHLRAGTWASPSDAARGTFQNNAISFDGSSDFYSLLSAISITESMTVVRAFKRASAGIKSTGLGATGTSAPRDPFWFTSNAIFQSLGGSGSSGSADTSTGSFVVSGRRNASTQSVRLNGAAYALSVATAPAVSGSFDLFGRTNIDYNSGEISFLAVFPTELTGADLTLVEQIAAATNGATLS